MRNFEAFYEHLTEYIDNKGDIYVPSRYVCEDGFKLGYYVLCVRTGYTKITKEQRRKLDAMHFAWDGRKKGILPETFERYFQLIQKYYQKYGNCDIMQGYRDEDNNRVGYMASYLRVMEGSLNQEQRKRLNEIHFVWHCRKPRTSFEEFCKRHIAYEKEHGSCYIPVRYEMPDGTAMGQIARNFRHGKRKLSDEQRNKLSEIGFIWNANEYRKANKKKGKQKKAVL